jgi:hypothetical protein
MFCPSLKGKNETSRRLKSIYLIRGNTQHKNVEREKKIESTSHKLFEQQQHIH